MTQNETETTTEATIYSHRTGLTELEEGDKIVFGEDADHGEEKHTIVDIEGAEEPSDIRVKVHEDGAGSDGYMMWTLQEIEGATESNDAHIERDGETIA
jgi:hypothetical protein